MFGKRLGLVGSATQEAGSFQVEIEKIVHRFTVLGIQLYRALKIVTRA
jgi:hypothetical protein